MITIITTQEFVITASSLRDEIENILNWTKFLCPVKLETKCSSETRSFLQVAWRYRPEDQSSQTLYDLRFVTSRGSCENRNVSPL
jgi:hypothetical protein